MKICWMQYIHPILFQNRTQPFLILRRRSPLKSSSTWGLVMSFAFARIRTRNQNQIFKQISIVTPFKFSFQDWSHSRNFSEVKPTISRAVSPGHHLQVLHEAPSNSCPSMFKCTYSFTMFSSHFFQISWNVFQNNSPRQFHDACFQRCSCKLLLTVRLSNYIISSSFSRSDVNSLK